jgi:hypothetical protein
MINILYLENEETKDADDSPSTVLLDYPSFSKDGGNILVNSKSTNAFSKAAYLNMVTMSDIQ